MEVGNAVEHKCKESTSGYPHDGIYRIMEFCRMKNPTTREWVDAVIYRNIRTYENFVREKSDFEDNFKLVGNGSKV